MSAPAARPPRILLIGHVVAIVEGARHAHERWPGAAVEVLTYGRAPTDTPPPAGTTAVSRSLGMGGAASSARSVPVLLGRLRRRRYDHVALVQPRLDVNRVRGLLLAFAYTVGGPRTIALDPQSGRSSRPFRARVVALDLLRFILIRTVTAGLIAAATRVLEWAAIRAPAPAPGPVPVTDGSVIYLRTDLDLALGPLLAGGSVAHTEGILSALQRRGHAVEFWTTGEIAAVPPGVRERRLPVFLRPNVPWEVSELLSGLLQTIRPPPRPLDLAFIYQRYSLNNLAGVALARRWGVPLMLEANGSEVRWRENWSVVDHPQLARATERHVLGRSHHVAAVSANAARDLAELAPTPARLRIVPNGVEVARFSNADPAVLPFGPDAFVIGFAGLFYPWHGVRDLAEAFPLVLLRRPAARLLLVGDGEDAALVISILERHGIRDEALLTGLVPRDAVPGYLAAADVLASPHARNDDFIGSPIKLWEYMASGRAIVASRVAQIGEVLEDGHTGLLVSPGEPNALADALVALHDDPGLRARLGAAAQAEARDRHSWDARLEAMLADPA
jgi:glycosyltransferase involved in cell wall biosynthesis